MGKYKTAFDNLNTQLRKIDFNTSLNISLLLCFNDLHYFSDYAIANKLDENIFDVFERSVLNTEKRINNLETYANAFRTEYNKCIDFLNNFHDEDNLLYDECVNLCSAIIHIFELIFTKDSRHTLEIMKLCFENKEAFIQKNCDDPDEKIQKLLEKIAESDLSRVWR